MKKNRNFNNRVAAILRNFKNQCLTDKDCDPLKWGGFVFMGAKIKVRTGERFGRLVVIRELQKVRADRRFEFQCDCGKITITHLSEIRNGHTKSCGCLRSDLLKKTSRRHGKRNSKIYYVWQGIKKRCNDTKGRYFPHYKSQGIKYCDEWNDFNIFYSWAMESGYKEGLTIERVNVYGNYEPSNCVWIPQSEQPLNQRRSLFYALNGKKYNLRDIADYKGITLGAIRHKHYRNQLLKYLNNNETKGNWVRF